MGKRDFDGAFGVDFSSDLPSDFINAKSSKPMSTPEVANPAKSL